MQVSVEITNGLQRRMTVGVPKERIDEEVTTRLKSLARKTRINGFRPGKVPIHVVKQRFGKQVRQEVVGEAMQESLEQAFTEEKLHPAGAPTVENLEDKGQGNDLSYTVSFEVYPELENIVTDGLKVERLVAKVEEADVDQMIEDLRKQRCEWEEVDRPAADGDLLEMDYHGTIDGEEFAGNKAEKQTVILGNKTYLEEFEKALPGASTGSVVEVDLNFPETYSNKDIAGKTALFKITVNKVSGPKYPEVDEEFVKSLQVEGGVEGLRKEVRENLETELERETKRWLKNQVFNGLLEANPLEAPQVLVDREAQRLADNMKQELESRNISARVSLPEVSEFKKDAEKRVKTGILTGELVSNFELKPDAGRVRELIESYAAGYEYPEELINWYYADPRRLLDVETAVLEEQIMDRLLETAIVNEVSMSFADLLKKVKEQ